MGRWIPPLAAVGVVAGAIGAGAARAADGEGGGAAVGLGLIVGLVVSLLLGAAGFVLLWADAPGLRGRRWLAATTLAGGVGAAFGALSGPAAAVLLAALLVLLAQTFVLRGTVRAPARWLWGGVLAWVLPGVVVFADVATADATWSAPAAVGYGALTGLIAGALLGAGTGLLAPSLDGQPFSRRMLLRALASPLHRLLPDTMVGLAVRGRTSGVVRHFPVLAAPDGPDLVVLPGHPETKQWWRNLSTASGVAAAVRVCRDGRWDAAVARLLAPGDPGREEAARAYAAAHPKVTVPADAPLVVVTRSAP